MKKLKLSNQKGLTLIEVIIAIGIGAIATALATAAMASIIASNKPAELVQQMADIDAAAITCSAMNGSSFKTCTLARVVELGLLNNKYGDGTGTNVYDGDFTLNPAPGNTNRYVSSANNIASDEDCSSLLDMYKNKAISVTCTGGVLTVTKGS